MVNRVLTLPPSVKTVTARTPPMPEAMIAYSIAVAPLSSAEKRPGQRRGLIAPPGDSGQMRGVSFSDGVRVCVAAGRGQPGT